MGFFQWKFKNNDTIRPFKKFSSEFSHNSAMPKLVTAVENNEAKLFCQQPKFPWKIFFH